MAYTIIRSNGTTLTTIQDGTINTVSTSLSLPGRNYAGYGQALNTNFVRVIENFASDTPPANPLKGQLWFNTTLNTLNVCPADGTTSSIAWLTLTSTNSGGSATLGNLTVTGNIATNNLSVTNSLTSDTLSVRSATVSADLTVGQATITSAVAGAITTQTISTGAPTTTGTITGTWTLVGNAASGGNGLVVSSGNIAFGINSLNGIKCDKYMYANGTMFNPSGTYTNGNVADYLAGTNGITAFTGNITPTKITTATIAGGGTISGIWTLAAGARIQATYADLAERFAADAVYEVGTVVELGGAEEVTAVVDDLSETIFGVVSNTAAYLMNSMAGENDTHPPIALSGRVEVKVIGEVKKGDRLVSAGKGFARAAKEGEVTAFNSIGRALVDKTTSGEGTVKAIVMVK